MLRAEKSARATNAQAQSTSCGYERVPPGRNSVATYHARCDKRKSNGGRVSHLGFAQSPDRRQVATRRLSTMDQDPSTPKLPSWESCPPPIIVCPGDSGRQTSTWGLTLSRCLRDGRDGNPCSPSTSTAINEDTASTSVSMTCILPTSGACTLGRLRRIRGCNLRQASTACRRHACPCVWVSSNSRLH